MRRTKTPIRVLIASAITIVTSCAAAQSTTPAPAQSSAALVPAWTVGVAISGLPYLAATAEAVFVGTGESGLSAYSSEDGRKLWESSISTDSRPVLLGTLVGTVSRGAVVFVHQQTGQDAWRAELAPQDGGRAADLVAAGQLAVATSGRQIRVWRADGTEAWRQTLDAEPVTAVVPGEETLFVAIGTPDSSLLALDPASGSVKWRASLPGSPASLAVSGSDVFFSAPGALYAYKTTPAFERSWRHSNVDGIGPAVVDKERVYFTLIDNTLQAFDRGSGGKRWSYYLTWRPVDGPLLGSDELFVALGNGTLAQVVASTGRAVASDQAKPPASTTRLNAVAASPDVKAVYAVLTDEKAARTLQAWKPAKR